MPRESLVKIMLPCEEETMVGSGTYVVGNFIVTCKHVWKQVLSKNHSSVVVEFAKYKDTNGKKVRSNCYYDLIYNEFIDENEDLVFLRPVDFCERIDACVKPAVSMNEAGKQGVLYIYSDRVPSTGSSQIAGKGRTPYKSDVSVNILFKTGGTNGDGYVQAELTGENHQLMPGNSGSPAFFLDGEQLQGIVAAIDQVIFEFNEGGVAVSTIDSMAGNPIASLAKTRDTKIVWLIPGITIHKYLNRIFNIKEKVAAENGAQTQELGKALANLTAELEIVDNNCESRLSEHAQKCINQIKKLAETNLKLK